jgi:hypothetical protein
VAVPRGVVRMATTASGASGGVRLRLARGYVVELGPEFETKMPDRLLAMLQWSHPV